METDITPVNIFTKGARNVFVVIDKMAFGLLNLSYQLFFTVASVDLFSSDFLLGFYKRAQLILGVFMIFQLALTILKGIINPDNFFKNDKNGAGNLVSRVAIALILFTVLIPLNTPGNNEYQKNVNNNGLLFGTLFSLQHRILTNNTLGRLILGTDATTSNYVSTNGSNSQNDELEKASNMFTTTVLKSFYRINLKPKKDRPSSQPGVDDAAFSDNRVCPDWDSTMLDAYTKEDADQDEIFEMALATCDGAEANIFQKALGAIDPALSGSSYFYLVAMPILPAVVAIIFAVLLLSFAVDITVRSAKLVVLRVIAPIPIISYMDPGGSKDSSFNSWTKSLVSTYLDLFVRLASIYLAIFLINSMIISGSDYSLPDGLLGLFAQLIIWIGLFAFAKQAPKFIKSALGLKDNGGKLFGGFGDIAAVISTGAALGASAVGSVGAGIAAARGSRLSDEARRANGEKDVFGNDINPNSLPNKAKHLVAGIVGGVTGGVSAGKSGVSAKDHKMAAAIDDLHKRNASAINRGSSGSTLFGRMGSGFSQVFTGEGSAEEEKRNIESMQAQKEALDAIAKHVTKKTETSDKTRGTTGTSFTGTGLDNSGAVVSLSNTEFNYKSVSDAIAATPRGQDVVIEDVNHNQYTVDSRTALSLKETIKDTNEAYYIEHFNNDVDDKDLASLIEDANAKGGIRRSPTDSSVNVTTRQEYKDAIGNLDRDIRERKRNNKINEANDKFSGKK